MTAYTDNAAGRLHNVLAAVKGITGSVHLGTAWSSALGIPQEERGRLLEGIARVVLLAGEARSDILGAHSEIEELCLRWVGPVDTALQRAHLLEQGVTEVTKYFGPDHLQSLEIASHQVHMYRPGKPVSEIDKERALELVTQLLEVLNSSSDLDEATKSLLIRHAAAIQLALNLLDVVGAQGLEDAVAGAIGAGISEGIPLPPADRRRAQSRGPWWS